MGAVKTKRTTKRFSELDTQGKLARIQGLREALPSLKELTGRQDIGVTDESTSAGYIKYRGVLGDVEHTVSVGGNIILKQLQKKHGVSGGVVLRWLDGRQPAFLARIVKNDVILPIEEDVEFALLLGHLTGKTKKPSKTKIAVRHKDERLVRRLRDGVSHIQDIENECWEKDGYHNLEIRHPRLVKCLNDVTEDKTCIPWEHVKTRNERIAYLQGFFRTKMGGIGYGLRKGLKSPRVRISKNIPNVLQGEEPRLFVDLQILFMKLGIQSTLWKSPDSDRWYVDVNELSSLQQILDLKPDPNPQNETLLPDKKHNRGV